MAMKFDVQYKMEAMAEPMLEDDDGMMSVAEYEAKSWARECELFEQYSIDPHSIKMINFSVTGWDEGVWTIATDPQTKRSLEDAGWLFPEED